MRNKKGITLLALVITIIVLIILAGVTINMILGDNGILTKAKEAKFKAELAKVDEEFKLYATNKALEDNNFELGTLNAGKNLLTYNTKPEDEEGNIKTILSQSEQKYVNCFEVIKGELIYSSQNERELRWALEIGMKINPYLIVDGVLLSADTNLMLMDEATGTIVVPESVTAIGEGTFANVKGMRRIIIPSTVREIRKNAFNGNTTLEEIIFLTDGDNGVEKIGESAFYECSNLKIVHLPNTVKELGRSAFAKCESLVDVELSANIKKINEITFQYCTNLTEIIIPEGVETLQNGVFQNNVKLKKISLPTTLTTMGSSVFYNCNNIETIENNSEENFIYKGGILLNKDKTEMKIITKASINGSTFTIPDTVTTLESAGIASFSQIRTVIIPSSVTNIVPTFFNYLVTEIIVDSNNKHFSSNNGELLSKDETILYLHYLNTETIDVKEGVKEIREGAFRPCTNVQKLNLPNSLEILSQRSMAGMSKLKQLKLGKNVSDINSLAFWQNIGLEQIEIDEENQTYMSENGAIYSKDKTKLIIVPITNVTQFNVPNGVKEISTQAFNEKQKLISITIPETVQIIRYNAFNGCTGLKSIEIPSSVKTIDNNVFLGCQNLREIIIRKEKGSITGSPWGCIYGERAIKWQP